MDAFVTYTVQLFHLIPFPSLLRPQEMQTRTSNHTEMKEVTKYKASKLMPMKCMCITQESLSCYNTGEALTSRQLCPELQFLAS